MFTSSSSERQNGHGGVPGSMAWYHLTGRRGVSSVALDDGHHSRSSFFGIHRGDVGERGEQEARDADVNEAQGEGALTST
jgi:hypothetical protein